MTKITYNMYTCSISGMSIETMKMDGRDSVECQNWEKRDIKVIFELFKLDNRTKECYSVVSFIKPTEKNVNWGRGCSGQTWRNPRERTSVSL